MRAVALCRIPAVSGSLSLLLALWAPACAAAPAPVAVVGGDERIDEADVADFSAAEACYGPDALTARRASFMRLFEGAITVSVLRREAGQEPARADYEKEAARVDRETKAPDILLCIKRLFSFEPGTGFKSKGGEERYHRIFLRKLILNSRFYGFVSEDAKVQKAYREARGKVAEGLKQGRGLADLGAELHLAFSTRTYAVEASTREAGGPPWNPFEKDFIEARLKGLAPGELAPPIDEGQGSQFVRLLSKDGGRYHFESLLVPKLDAAAWLRTIPKLSCVINDLELDGWVRGLVGNPMLAPCRYGPDKP